MERNVYKNIKKINVETTILYEKYIVYRDRCVCVYVKMND